MHDCAACLPAGRRRAWQVAVCGTRARLHGDDAGAEFVRFVTVGVASSVGDFALFLALPRVGPGAANLGALLVSPALAPELPPRVAFPAGGRVRWFTAQSESGGL